MKKFNIVNTLILLLLLGFSTIAASGIPVPDIPKGKGDSCVEPTEDMRINHMTYLLHQRDETVYKGIRTIKHSLKECIDCHEVKDENNMPVNYKDKRHFCNSCHEYTSVQIDCFDCHTSTPGTKNTRLTKKPAKFFSSVSISELNPQVETPHE